MKGQMWLFATCGSVAWAVIIKAARACGVDFKFSSVPSRGLRARVRQCAITTTPDVNGKSMISPFIWHSPKLKPFTFFQLIKRIKKKGGTSTRICFSSLLCFSDQNALTWCCGRAFDMVDKITLDNIELNYKSQHISEISQADEKLTIAQLCFFSALCIVYCFSYCSIRVN